MGWSAVVLAGGRESGPLASAMGTDIKALAKVGAKTSLEWTLEALARTEARGVTVVGSPELARYCNAVRFCPEGDSITENLRIGLAALPDAQHFLLLPADSPALDPQDLNRFMRGYQGGVATSLTPFERFKTAYPTVPTKALRLREGAYLSGAPYAIDRTSFHQVVNTIERFRNLRKSPFQLLLAIGFKHIFRAVTGKYCRTDVEGVLKEKFGVTRAWIDLDGHPSLALDFDTVDEYHAIQKYF